MIQRLTRSRGIQLNRRPAYLARNVRVGDIVSARVESRSRESSALAPVAMDLAILHEDAEVLVIDKPPDIIVHPTSPRHQRTLAHGVAFHLRRQGMSVPVRPVHRLDRDTSGAILFAKSGYAHQFLDRQLREGKMHREYVGVVAGLLEHDSAWIESPIGRSEGAPTLRAVNAEGDPARTHYEVIERLPSASVLRLRLETGRTHQIRVHLAHAGHPLIADRDYGAGPVPDIGRTALHSAALSFDHPRTGERLFITAPLAADIEHLIASLRRSS